MRVRAPLHAPLAGPASRQHSGSFESADAPMPSPASGTQCSAGVTGGGELLEKVKS